MRLTLSICLLLVVAACAAAQEPDQPVPGMPNSISHLLASHPPELQAGYVSDGDLFMLYSWRFDLLSNGAQKFLLKKYGYLDFEDFGLDSRKPGTPHVAALRTLPGPAAVAPGANIRVSLEATEIGRRLQSETSIAVNGQNIVVGFNDGDKEEQAVAYSRDGGATWQEGRLPFYPGRIGNSGDPAVAAGPNGRFYHSYLAATAVGFLTTAVAYSDDGGATWIGPFNASASLGGSAGSLDKEWLAVDNTPGSAFRGNVYLSCTRFASNGQDSIRFSRSTDGGKTWPAAIALTTLNAAEFAAFQNVQGSFIAIGPNGEVYVAWYDSRFDGIRLVKSVDGGVTFSNPVTVLSGIGFPFSYYVPGTFDTAAFPQVAVDKGSGANRGAVYVVANVLNFRNGIQGNLDVVLARSGDGGVTFDAPVRVNNDATNTDQFQPAIAVADNGNVGVAFYDRRNDPSDVLTDVYLAISSDGGRTFPVQQRVTTTSWLTLPTPFGYRTGYHGDYNQMVASGGNFFLTWGDDRNGKDPDVYMAMIPVSGGLPDFTLAATKPWADILAGDSATFTYNTGSSGNLSAAVSPATGVSVQAAGNSMTATSTSSTAPGTYTITATLDNGSIQRSTETRLTVHPAEARRAPAAITSTRDPSHNSHSSVDAKGNVHVIMNNSVISRRPKRISYLQIPANGQPLAPVTVAGSDLRLTEELLLEPHIGASRDGNIYAVWRRSNRSGNSILFSVSTDGGRSFSAPMDISAALASLGGQATTFFGIQPAIAVGSNGTIFISYVRQTFTVTSGVLLALDVVLTRSTDGGKTFSIEVVAARYSGAAPTLSTASPPALALDSSDNPYLVWAGNLGAPRGTDIYMGRSRDGGLTFDPAVNASQGNTTSLTPRHAAIAVDAKNVIYVAYNSVDALAGLGDNLLAVSTDGVRFAAASNLSNATFFTGSITDWPSLGVDASGNLTAVWRQWVVTPYKGNDTQRDIFFTRCTNQGASCTTPVNISSSLGDTLLAAGGGSVQPPALVVDSSGRVYVFYDDDTAGSTQVMMWTYQ